MACPEELVARRIPSQNILSRLAARQMFGASYRRHSLNTVRGFHTNIFPDFTLVCERVTYLPFYHDSFLGKCGEATLLFAKIQS